MKRTEQAARRRRHSMEIEPAQAATAAQLPGQIHYSRVNFSGAATNASWQGSEQPIHNFLLRRWGA